MADNPLDPNPALRAELEAALVVLEPELRGLRDLYVVSISPPLQASVNEQILERQDRDDKINAVLTALDNVVLAREALAETGYPALPDKPLPPDQFAELDGQEADLKAAIGVFVLGAAPATSVSLDLSAATDVPQPVPPVTATKE